MRTVEHSYKSHSSSRDVLVQSLTMSLRNPVTHQSGDSPGDLPALVHDLLGADVGGLTALLGDVTALLLVDLKFSQFWKI